MLLKPPLYDYCGGLNVGGSVLFIKGQVPFQCEFSILSNYVSARFFAYNGQLSLRPLRDAATQNGACAPLLSPYFINYEALKLAAS